MAHKAPTLLLLMALSACVAPQTPSAPLAQHPSAQRETLAPAPTSARSVSDHREARTPFTALAHDLLANLQPGQRIALQPFRAADVPVSLAAAQGFNDALARAIEAAPGAPAVIVARQELPRLFVEAEEFGKEAEVQHLLEAAEADVLLIGAVAPAQGGIDISYKAFDVRTGRELASAPPRFLAVDISGPSGLTLDQALAAAADSLAHDAPDMKTVETLGIYYQQSGVQTALGGYVGHDLVGRLVQKIGGLQAGPAALLRPDLQGIERLDDGGTEQMMVRARTGVFLLSGTVWDFGADVELRLALQGDGDRVASYAVRIRRDSLPPGLLPVTPPDAQVAEARMMHSGPSSIQLSSDRGRRPVYAIGDAAHLVVQTARDAYLYCFHQASTDAGGGITKIFPNQYHRDAHIRGQVSQQIPDDAMNFVFRVYGPAGVEYVRCFALDHDVDATLPRGITGRDLAPIDVHSLDDLGQIFRTQPAGVSEATMVMTIDPKK